jgi:hypothetical protein
MAITPVFTKDAPASLAQVLDLSQILAVSENIVTIVVTTISPITVPPLTCVVSGFALQQATLTLSGGFADVSYGVLFTVTTSSARTLQQVAAVYVAEPGFTPFQTTNPYAYQALLDTLVPGEAGIGKAFFSLPQNTSATGAYVKWSVIDQQARVYSSGNSFQIIANTTSFATTIEALSVVHVPSSISPTLNDQRYQVRWELVLPSSSTPMYLFESIKVVGLSTVPLGATDTVEIQGDVATVAVTTRKLFDQLGYEIFKGNTKLVPFVLAANPQQTSEGWYYEAAVATTLLPAQLDPFQLSWKYWNVAKASLVYRETSKLFCVTPSILIAVEDVRMMVEKARSTLLNFPDVLFETTTILSWLIRGRDMFNAAGGQYTSFDMTDATSGVREFWLRYSEIAMLRSQALAEGEKAFDFQGQAISLNVDKTQYYTALADALQATVDPEVGPFKKTIKIQGLSGGTGNMSQMGGNRGQVGIQRHPLTALYIGQRTW